MFKEYAITVVNITSDVLQGVILIYVLGSWIISRDNKAFMFIESLAKPILAPIKKLMPAQGGLDLSPMIAFLLIDLLANLLIAILSNI